METSLTSAHIIRRSPGAAVCRPERHAHMWLWCKATEELRCCCRSGGRASLCWQTQIITKSLSCWVLPTQRDRFSFPPLLPPLFFFFPQPHTIVNTMMAALNHRSGFSEQDRTPPPIALYAEYCTGLNCLTDASTPFLFSDRKLSDSGFFPPFSTLPSWLPSFIFFLSLSLGTEVPLWHGSPHFWEHYSNNRRWPVWSPTSWAMHSFPTAVSYFGMPRLAGQLIFRVECKTTLQPAYRQHTLLHVSAKTHLLLTLATWAWER